MSTSPFANWLEGRTQSAAAEYLGVSQPLVSHWARTGRIAAEHVLSVESKTGISRHVLRPDVFGPPTAQAA